MGLVKHPTKGKDTKMGKNARKRKPQKVKALAGIPEKKAFQEAYSALAIANREYFATFSSDSLTEAGRKQLAQQKEAASLFLHHALASAINAEAAHLHAMTLAVRKKAEDVRRAIAEVETAASVGQNLISGGVLTHKRQDSPREFTMVVSEEGSLSDWHF